MNHFIEDTELLDEFISESTDLLDDIEPLFIELEEKNENDKDAVNRIFRAFHSIKGSAGFLNFGNIAYLTHNAETLLDLLRNDGLAMVATCSEILLEAVDALRAMLSEVVGTQSDESMKGLSLEISEALAVTVQKIRNEINSPGDETAIEEEKPMVSEIKLNDNESEEDLEIVVREEMNNKFIQEAMELLEKCEEYSLEVGKAPAPNNVEFIQEAFRAFHSLKGNCGFMGLADFEKVSHAAENILDGMRHGTIEAEDQNIDLLLRVVDTLKEGMARYSENGNTEIPNCALLVEFLSEFNPGPVKPVEKRSRGENENLFPKMKDKTNGTEAKRIKRKDLRVDVDKLDSLVDLVGELVIAESMVLGNKKIIEADDEELERSVHHLKRVSSALQDVAMSVRMIPLSGTFKKMIRLVHDLAGKSGKSAEIVISGEDTEVDKNVIEEISDPIVHIIRNSVDHGLETPEERLREGKSQTGRISLDARHEGGEVRITVSDDGHGLDREKILKKAFSRDMISKDPGSLNDEEVFSLIFEPGFSTADEVTDVSGRGVGMDVVKKNIEKINGKINISSEKGKGTFITLHIPLTMAVIDGMLVKAGRQRFTLPLLSVKESVIASNYKITTTPDGRETVKIRNEILPVLRMEEVYNGKMPGTINNRAVFVIVEASSDVVALCVDEIIGQQEIVIKGLSGILGRLKGVSGCTVLGNGEVSLIADVEDLVRRAVGK